MVSEFKNFMDKNLPDVIIGLVVGTVIAILAPVDLSQGLTIIILGPLFAIILSSLLRVFENELNINQRTAMIILIVIAAFLFMQQFQLGVFSLESVTQPLSLGNSIQAQSFTKITGIVRGFAGISKLGIFGVIGVIFSLLFALPQFRIIGIIFLGIVIIFIGLPLIGLSIAVIKNFQLISIFLGLLALGNLVFKAKLSRRISRNG